MRNILKKDLNFLKKYDIIIIENEKRGLQMKIVTYILTDSMGEPDIFSSIGEVKDILIDIINYEHKDCPSLKEFELKEIEQLFSWLEEDKDKSFSFYIDEREFGVYKKELKIPCGY